MVEHCIECKGTGKIARKTCLHCAGSGIEPKQGFKLGRFHMYPAMKRDAMIIIGLVALLFILNVVM